MNRPLLISDCDEVLLHMIVPFRDWLDEAHAIDFPLDDSDFSYKLTRRADGSRVEPDDVWKLLHGFFISEMYRQYPIIGAVEAIGRIQEIADVVILTNLLDDRAAARAEQLKDHGIHARVYTNQGGKGDALARIIAEYQPSASVFVDDLYHQHQSVAEIVPDIWRLHFVGEPLMVPHIKASPFAHDRIDAWANAESWITDKLLGNAPAPLIEKEMI